MSMLNISKESGVPVLGRDTTPDNGGLQSAYLKLVECQKIEYDQNQWKVLQHLQLLLDELCKIKPLTKRWPLHFSKRFIAGNNLSLYIHGDVGRGKSMLMNLFYEACPETVKRRAHFNEFMVEVHHFIHHSPHQGNRDALSALAENIKASCRVLCFDEFHVTDVADAMILGRLFSKLFEFGVILVITSNRHPKNLYQGGVQKEQFQFFENLLSSHTHILELDTPRDYRSTLSRHSEVYYFPLDKQEPGFIVNKYRQLAGDSGLKPLVLDVYRHKLTLSATNGNVVLVRFEELCAKPLGVIDYLALVGRFQYVIVRGIPKLSADKRNEAKRFVTLIDVLYEHKVKLICSAEAPPHELYLEGDGAFEFRRTASRLLEMQSQRYWQLTLPHLSHRHP